MSQVTTFLRNLSDVGRRGEEEYGEERWEEGEDWGMTGKLRKWCQKNYLRGTRKVS